MVVTRAATQAGKLATQLREHGAEVLELPTIKIEPPTKHDLIVDAIAGLNSYDWLVFTSANGVTAFFDFFFKAFDDLRDLGGARIAAVGPGTAARLKELHLKVDVMPAEALGKKVAKALSDYESMENLRVVLLRAEKANPELPELLAEMGAIVDDIPCYRTVPETEVEENFSWIQVAEPEKLIVKRGHYVRISAVQPQGFIDKVKGLFKGKKKTPKEEKAPAKTEAKPKAAAK
jgi:uroporphyrinogen III methyltransferase/synthase